MLAGPEKIKDFIPQKDPFVMIDTLYECSEKFVKTGFTPPSNSIFSENGLFTEPGLIENMAQSAAAGTGYYYTQQNKEIPVGFIGAIKDFQLVELPAINRPLITEINVVAEVMNASVIKADIKSEGKIIASCEMKIFIVDPGNLPSPA